MKRLAAAVLGSTVVVGCSSSPEPLRDQPYDEGSYQTTVHFIGLDEDVTIVKSPDALYAVRPDGSEIGYLALLALENTAQRERFGSLTPETQRALSIAKAAGVSRGRDARQFDVGVMFALPVDWSAIARAMTDDATHARAQIDLEGKVAAAARDWQVRLEALGLRVTGIGHTMPVIFGVADVHGLETLRGQTDIKVWLAEPSRMGNDVLLDTVQTSHIDIAFGQPLPTGSYAATERIGILEGMGTSAIFENHEAFTQATISYQVPPPFIACSSVTQCGCVGGLDICGDCSAQNVACAAGRCVSDHTSKTASVIASYTAGQPFSSAKANLFISNAGAGNFASNLAAFQYFDSQNVKLVNMSFSYSAPEGPVEDYYARLGMLVMKSSGNSLQLNPSGACAFQANAVCVGAVRHNMTMWPSSVFANPNGTDREEPDVVALGGDNVTCNDTVHALNANTSATNDWSGFFNATSAATPIVTSMMALTREYCTSLGYAFSPRWARAILKASLGVNPSGWRYETPGKSFNGQDGAGLIFADDLKSWCAPGTPGKQSGDTPIDLTGGGPGPDGTPPPRDPPIGPFAVKDGVRPLSGQNPGMADGRTYLPLGSWSFNKNARLRAVISWDSCVTNPNDSQPLPVLPDFDLFLHTLNGGGQYVYSSQSVADNSEGFDVDIAAAGTYTVYVAWPTGAMACGGGTVESLAWAFQWFN